MHHNTLAINRSSLFVIAWLMVCFATAAMASAPQLMNYQGRLTDPAGNAVANGSSALTIGIWATESGGSPLWTETHSTVQVTGGVFTVLLGSIVSLNDSLFRQPDRWIGISVGAEVISPRTRLASVPYAYQAGSLALRPTETPGPCDAAATGSFYYDSSSNEPCYCNGTGWMQLDGGGPCGPASCVDVDSDGWDTCDPLDAGDMDGLPRDCNDGNVAVHPGAAEACFDGIDNDCDNLIDCLDPGCACSGPSPGDLVITEIMADPSAIADATGEWFEILNVSGIAFNLNGLIIQDAQGADTIQTNLIINPAGLITLAISANPGFTPDFVYSGIILGNVTDQIRLVWGVTQIDVVVYGTGWPLTAGFSLTLNPNTLDATSNDVLTNWCKSSSVFGVGDKGTPGAILDSCP